MSVKPVKTAEEVSSIAFGFMASKAMFAGLHLDVFTNLADGPKSCEKLSEVIGVPLNRIVTLMTALNGVGLVEREDDLYANSPGAEAFLSRTSKYDFGDYLRYQIDQQMYPFLGQLNDVLDGSLNSDAVDSYQHWMSDPEQAALYSNAQHAGSLGPGLTIARTVDLSGATSLLDVGGGSGAFAIVAAEKHPDLTARIIDFPNVEDTALHYIEEAGLSDRVGFIPGNALETDWPAGQDAILMSYLFSGIPGGEVPRLVKYAYDCLAPGGRIMVHDFMVEDDRTGPVMAALWQLQHMAFTPEARSVTAGWLKAEMKKVGFVDIQDEQTIPGMTHLVHARKPD